MALGMQYIVVDGRWHRVVALRPFLMDRWWYCREWYTRCGNCYLDTDPGVKICSEAEYEAEGRPEISQCCVHRPCLVQ